MLRITSSLPPSLEQVITATIGCCLRVHRELGPGLLEHVYMRALAIELDDAAISFEREKEIAITYRDRFLCHQRLDLVIDGQLVVELKAVDRLAPVYHAQLLSYLHASGLRAGLLVNFNVPILKQGIKRLVL